MNAREHIRVIGREGNDRGHDVLGMVTSGGRT
jgi:hypothetical protein